MEQTLQQRICQRNNDYSQLEAKYYRQTGVPMVDDPYTSILHPLPDITLSVSVVIPAWNVASSIEQVLISIEQNSFNQKYPDQLEVIVVDDGSQDETWQILQRLDLNIHLKAIYQDHQGRSQACNTAIAMSERDIIICCDADIILSTFAIEELMKRHQIYEHDQVLLLGFRTQLHSGNPSFEHANLRSYLKGTCSMFYGDPRVKLGICPQTHHLKQLGRGKAICNAFDLWHDLPLQVHGFLFSLRRHDFLAINGYDEGFRGWGYEDIMVGAHAIAQGNCIIPVYSAAGWHIQHAARDASNWSAYARNQVYYYQRLHDPFPIRDFHWQKRARERALKSFERHPSRTYTRGTIDPSYDTCYKNLSHDLNALGFYYFQLGRYQEAAQIFAEIRGTESEEVAATLMRGKSLRMAGCIDEAIALLEQGLSSQISSPMRRMHIGAMTDYALALAAQGRFFEARQQFRCVEEVLPDNLVLRALLEKPLNSYAGQIRVYLRQQDYTLALQSCEMALILEPHSLLMQVQRAHLLALLGRQEAVQKARQFTITNVPLDAHPESYTFLSQAWEHLTNGRPEPAKIAFEQLLQFHPGNPYVLQNLQALHTEVARLHRLPLASMIAQEVQAIPGFLTPEELTFLITLTTWVMARLHGSSTGLFIDTDSYCGQATVAMGLALRGMGCSQRRLVAVYQPWQEPTKFGQIVVPAPRELCRQALWQYELTEQVLCIPEQGSFPQEQVAELVLVTGTNNSVDFPPDIAHYVAVLASGGLVLAYPYNYEHPSIQQWVNALLLDSHYTLLGQVGQLIAFQAPAEPVV